MRDLDDSIAWTEGGDNALSGTHDGKEAVGELWGKLKRAASLVAPLLRGHGERERRGAR